MKRFISIMLCFVIVLTSGAISVFATDDIDSTNNATAAEADDTASQEAAEEVNPDAIDGSVLQANVADEDRGFAITWDKINGNKVTLSWTALANATYTLYIDNKPIETGLKDTEYQVTDLSIATHKAKVEAIVDETVKKSATISFEITDYVDDVEKLEAMSGYGSVSIYFTPVDGAVKYIIAKSTNKNAANFNADNSSNVTIAASKLTKVKEPWSGSKKYNVYKYTDSNSGTMTYYKVYAVSAGGAVSEASPVSGDKRVEYIKYKFTLKKNKTLTSHNASGGNKTVTFKKGTTFVSDGFGGGKYKFYYKIGGKSYYFYCNAVDCKNASAIYDKKNNYTRTEAENYVNEHKFTSSTNYLIFASLYTQHVYIFKGSKGNWTCFKDFESSSGAAYAATPSGTDKYLLTGSGSESNPGKKASRHNRKWWSPFSSWNSFHSKLTKQSLGSPASKGCIRLNVDDAYYIYKNIPVRTKCIVL